MPPCPDERWIDLAPRTSIHPRETGSCHSSPTGSGQRRGLCAEPLAERLQRPRGAWVREDATSGAFVEGGERFRGRTCRQGGNPEVTRAWWRRRPQPSHKPLGAGDRLAMTVYRLIERSAGPVAVESESRRAGICRLADQVGVGMRGEHFSVRRVESNMLSDL